MAVEVRQAASPVILIELTSLCETGVGIQGVMLAKAMGMRPIVIDSGAQKKELSTKVGAEVFVDFKEHEDVGARVKEIADGVGAHGVLVTAYQAYKGVFGSRVRSGLH